MKLGVAERMSPCDGWEEDGEVGQGAISGVRVSATLTIDDSDIEVGEHDDDCEGCPLCRKPRTRRSRARKVAKVTTFREVI